MRQKISMTCPTRDRVAMLERLINNIYAKGTEKLNSKDYFELIFVVDNDDVKTLSFFNDAKDLPSTIKVLLRERSEWFNRDYPNFAAAHTTGDLIWGIGDDIEIQVENWDQLLLEKANLFENYIKRGSLENEFYNWPKQDLAYLINIDCQDGDFENYLICRPSFPIITREAYETIGFLVPPEWKFWGADMALGEMFRRANRVLTLGEFKIGHWTYNNKNKHFYREEDKINENTKSTLESCPMTKLSLEETESIINSYAAPLNTCDQKSSPSRIVLSAFEEAPEDGISRLALQRLGEEGAFLNKKLNHATYDKDLWYITCPECTYGSHIYSKRQLDNNPKLTASVKEYVSIIAKQQLARIRLKYTDEDFKEALENYDLTNLHSDFALDVIDSANKEFTQIVRGIAPSNCQALDAFDFRVADLRFGNEWCEIHNNVEMKLNVYSKTDSRLICQKQECNFEIDLTKYERECPSCGYCGVWAFDSQAAFDRKLIFDNLRKRYISIKDKFECLYHKLEYKLSKVSQ